MTEKTFLCLYGKHKSGKSTIGRWVAETHGLVRAHPFNPGRAASLCWLAVHGAGDALADRMVDGDLKDTPWSLLPLDPSGTHYSMRKLMDVIGHFTGVALGPEWTIDMDVDHRDHLDRSAPLDVSGMTEPQAMAAGYAMFAGASGAEAREAVMEGSRICDARLPSGTVRDLVLAFGDMFDRYGMGDWKGAIGAEGAVMAPLRLVPPGRPDTPGYVLESAIHEMNHLRETKGDRCIVIRIVPLSMADVDDQYAAAVVSGIEPDFDFCNPMISNEDTWERFALFLENEGILDRIAGHHPAEPC